MRYSLPLAVALSACAKTVGDAPSELPEVGWIAELQTNAHGTAGTAEILDESTIELRDFTYDGGGLNARLFLLLSGESFRNDYELTDNLVGTEFDGDTLTLDIPAGSFGDWNLITLWCVPAGANFGEGVFEAP